LIITQHQIINSMRAVQAYKCLFLITVLVCTVLATGAYSQGFTFSQFIADTLVINLPEDSSLIAADMPLRIVDYRETPGSFLGIRQIKKWRYIPVDQYLVLPESLSTALGRYLPADTARSDIALAIDNIFIWYDGSPMFGDGWKLNGRTRLVGGKESTIRDWQWEQRIKKKRKQEIEDVIGELVGNWMLAQGKVLNEETSVRNAPPYRYRRQLLFQVDTIILPDGYILDGRLSFDFPADQMGSYIRGAPGMQLYYRKSSRHESVAVGGSKQQWLKRLRPSWLARLDLSFRIGFNSFNPDKYDYIHWRNIFLVNAGLTAAVEYRPPYYRGLFAGVGLHQSVNVLPEVVPRYATGLVLTAGVILP